jgi:uncharacterized protein YlxW (UPF0749 family)
MPETAMPDTTPTSQRRTGRQRLVDALVRPTRAQVVVAVLLAVVGFAAITQMRSYEVDDTYAGYREQDMIDVLNGLAATSQRAQAEISRLEQTREELLSTTSSRQAALEQAKERADNLEILAGTVPVTGPGIRITIEETEGPADIDSVLDMVQALRSAGAEAIQVNGEVRVVAQTSFEDGVGGIYVDDTLLSPPYVVDAIGAPSTLSGGLTFPSGPLDQLEQDGTDVQVLEFQSLDIESVRSLEDVEFAEPETAE